MLFNVHYLATGVKTFKKVPFEASIQIITKIAMPLENYAKVKRKAKMSSLSHSHEQTVVYVQKETSAETIDSNRPSYTYRMLHIISRSMHLTEPDSLSYPSGS